MKFTTQTVTQDLLAILNLFQMLVEQLDSED